MTDLGSILPLAAGAIAFLALATGFYALAAAGGSIDADTRRRLQGLVQRRGGAAAIDIAESIRRDTRDSSVVRVDALIKRLLPNPEKLRRRLAMTGRKITLGSYLAANLMLALLGAFLIDALMPLPVAVNIAAGVGAGLGLPWIVTGVLVRRRLGRFSAQFPDAIDLIVRGLRAGLPVSEAIKSVGEEFPEPVGVEFRHVAETMRLGRTLDEGLWEASKRFDTPDFKFFIVTLSIQKETGGNLAETLDHLSDLLRKRRQMKLKIRALSSEARASAYILGSLPFIMFAIIFTLNQEYAMSLFTDRRGVMMVGFGLMMILAGGGIMAKMVRFEI